MTAGGTESRSPLRILVLATDLASNSTGRVHVLWELARHLGWTARVVAPRGEEIWAPLRATPFADDCEVIPDGDRADERLIRLAEESDLIISAKPLPGALDRAVRIGGETRTPVLLDVDDPDLESRIGLGRPLHMIAKAVLRPRTFWTAVAMLPRARRLPAIVSNPALQRRYGGALVPHARSDSGPGGPFRTGALNVVFVGTNRRHKGVDVIRVAVARMKDHGVTLTVTDSAPVDAKPWETWVGLTTLPEGQRVVRSGDVVVLPSNRRSTVARFQLPAKLIDAMVAARPVVIADVEPMVWAAGDDGVVLAGDGPEDLVEALTSLLEPDARAHRGAQLRERALSTFTIETIAPTFRAACTAAVEDFAGST